MNGTDRLRERLQEVKDELGEVEGEVEGERDDLLTVLRAILDRADQGPITPDDAVLIDARAAVMNATLAAAA